jgi:tetratricopeptide (TPR) repeat protein
MAAAPNASQPITEQVVRKALVTRPSDAIAAFTLADFVFRRGDKPSALRWLDRASAVRPTGAPPWNRRGLIHWTGGDVENADRALTRAMVLEPSLSAAWTNHGNILKRRGALDRAACQYRRGTLTAPDDPTPQLNIGVLDLLRGRFATGWPLYRHRRAFLSGDPAGFAPGAPEWDGGILSGPLMVIAEQGIGDTVMFLTLLHAVTPRVKGLVILVERRLQALIARSIPDAQVFSPDEQSRMPPLPRVAAWVPSGDLPSALRLFHGGEAKPRAFLKPDAERARALRERLKGDDPRPLIGITWRSRAPDGWRRSISTDLWRPILDAGHRLISLQYGLTAEERSALDPRIETGHGIEPMEDLDGLVALVAAMDMVICPVNNTVHFAGALDVPCWTLLPTDPDWRWGLKERTSRWYPRMRLFRQDKRAAQDGDWSEVMERVRAALGTPKHKPKPEAAEKSAERSPERSPEKSAQKPTDQPTPALPAADAHADTLNKAVALHRAGRLDEAEALYLSIPDTSALHGNAANLMAVIRHSQGRMAEAVALSRDATRSDPLNVPAWTNRAVIERHAPSAPNAILPPHLAANLAALRSVLIEPARPDAIATLVATLSWARSDLLAVRAGRMVRTLCPFNLDALTDLANSEARLGDHRAALRTLKLARVSSPSNPAAWFNAGNSERDLEHYEQAAAAYRRALACDPGQVGARVNLANTVADLAQTSDEGAEAAEPLVRENVRLYPDRRDAWNSFGRILDRRRESLDPETEPAQALLREAIDGYRRAAVLEPSHLIAPRALAQLLNDPRHALRGLIVDPTNGGLLNRLALLAADTDDRSMVIPYLRKAAIANPGDGDALYNLGVEAWRSVHPHKVERMSAWATCVNPDHSLAHLNRALALLIQDDYARGWDVHRRRLASTDAAAFIRSFDIPEWQGEAPDALSGADKGDRGKLLLWGEQGIGDEIMFMTLLPELLDRGYELVVVTEPRLRPILRRSLPMVDVPEAPSPDQGTTPSYGCARHVALGDLPYWLSLFHGGKTKPVPWVKPPADRVAALRKGLEDRHPGQRLVGITWRSIAPKTGAGRTIEPALWRPFGEIPGIAFVSLQYGTEPKDFEIFEREAGFPLDHAHGVEPMKDLDGLTALIEACDLVLCPTNNTVHFAGAQGKPCWTLLPYKPDWRWGLTSDRSRWYEDMAVYRQTREGEWTDVIARVAADLRVWSESENAEI